MTTRLLGGLSGKARRVHHRGHADRKFEERLIADYLEPGERSRRGARDAPIRGRREFMPTVLAEADMTDGGKNSQLELAWDRRKDVDDRRAVDRRVVWSTGSETADAEQAVALIKVPSSLVGAQVSLEPEDKPDSETRVLRLPRRSSARMPLGWSQAPMARPRERLSLRGFARGCAIGGVAAAVALTVLSVALG